LNVLVGVDVKMYIVWAYRSGDACGYNFPVGVFESKELAESAANKHRNFRGLKYDHLIYMMEVGKVCDYDESTLVRGFIHPANVI
jgi:hypothetical protein